MNVFDSRHVTKLAFYYFIFLKLEKSSTVSLLQGTTEYECWSVIMTCIMVSDWP